MQILKKPSLHYDIDGNIELIIPLHRSLNQAVRTMLDGWQDGKTYELLIRLLRVKRSLDANSYYQALLDRLKDALRMDRDELHFDLLRRYGQTAVDSEGNKLIFSIISQIDGTKISKYVEVVGHGEVGGKDFTHYRVLKGSSEMDSREFSILLEGLIDECKLQNISTMTPSELAKLKGYTK